MNLKFTIPDEHLNVGKIYIDKIAENPLPPAYRAVEYLQSTGTQYIDTGFQFDKYWKYEIEASLDDINYNQMWGMNYTYNHGIQVYSNSYWVKGDQYAPSSSGTNTNIISDTKCKFMFDSNSKICDITGDNITQHYGFNAISPTSSRYRVVLFGTWNFWTDRFYNYGKGKIYRFKFYQKGVDPTYSLELVADMVPCKRKSDDKPGMYDIVRQTFLTNSGTGEFLTNEEAI